MSSRKVAKREREAIAEPMETEQASMPQNAAEMVRARAWEMHLRGIPKARIAQALSLDRGTVARYITAAYAEVAPEQKVSPARKLREAVARMRLVQEQAWNDHDSDDEREQSVLALSLAQAQTSQTPSDAKEGKPSSVSIRYQSQRAQYLRIILDAEKEIARLEGLYEGMVDLDMGIAVTFVKLSEDDVQRGRRIAQSGQIASSATHRAIQGPATDPADPTDGGESSG